MEPRVLCIKSKRATSVMDVEVTDGEGNPVQLTGFNMVADAERGELRFAAGLLPNDVDLDVEVEVGTPGAFTSLVLVRELFARPEFRKELRRVFTEVCGRMEEGEYGERPTCYGVAMACFEEGLTKK